MVLLFLPRNRIAVILNGNCPAHQDQNKCTKFRPIWNKLFCYFLCQRHCPQRICSVWQDSEHIILQSLMYWGSFKNMLNQNIVTSRPTKHGCCIMTDVNSSLIVYQFLTAMTWLPFPITLFLWPGPFNFFFIPNIKMKVKKKWLDLLEAMQKIFIPGHAEEANKKWLVSF